MKLWESKLEKYITANQKLAHHSLYKPFVEPWTLRELLAIGDKEFVQKWEELRFSPSDYLGMPFLRKEIAKLYQQIPAEQINVTAGADAAYFSACAAIIEPGDQVVVFTPCNDNRLNILKGLGAIITEVELDYQQGWRFNEEAFVRTIRWDQRNPDNTKLIVLNFPNFPTGAMLEESELKRILSMAQRISAHVISDESYRFLEYGRPLPLPAVADLYEMGMSIGSVEFAYGMPGMRLGWMATANYDFAARAAIANSYFEESVSYPSEVLAAMAIRASKLVLERNTTLLRDNLEKLDEFVRKYSDNLSWTKPEAGCMGVVLVKGFKMQEFYKDLLNQQKLLIMPGSKFNIGDAHLPIGFGARNFSEVLFRLERFLDDKL